MKRLTLLLVANVAATNHFSTKQPHGGYLPSNLYRTDPYRLANPGMGVTIFKDGELLLCKGFGSNLNNPQDSVDIHTLFQIGSVTKSFTAYLLATLWKRDSSAGKIG